MNLYNRYLTQQKHPDRGFDRMLYDNPRLFMMHFWAVDDPEKLARGIKP